MSDNALEIISVISKKAGSSDGKEKVEKDEKDVVSDIAAMEVVSMVKSMDGEVNDIDKSKIKITLKEMSPELTNMEATIISEIVQAVGVNDVIIFIEKCNGVLTNNCKPNNRMSNCNQFLGQP